MARTINSAGLNLIKTFEGCKLTSYADVGGIWTIGYGHTGGDVKPKQTCTQADADAWLAMDLKSMEAAVEGQCKSVPLTDNQFAALVAFAYNVGPGRLSKSTLLKKVLARDWQGARAEFAKWDKVSGQPVAGLTKRRRAEADLFASA